MSAVSIEDREHMSMLGLLIAGLLESAMADEARRRRAALLEGAIWLGAGRMWVTLRFSPDGVTLSRGRQGERLAEVGGDMRALVEVVAGRLPVLPFVAGRLRIGGSPLALYRLLPLLLPGWGRSK